MGLLDALGRGISAAGYAASNVGLEGVKATLEQEKIKLADELAGKREVARDERAEKSKIAGEERGIVNIPRVAAATTAATIANAPALRQVKIDDALAVHTAQLDFDTDPKNVEKKAVAEAAKDKFLKTAAADTAAELLQKPEYLENLKKIAMAEHPERAAQIAASMASVAKSQFELGQAKLLAKAKKDLADASGPEAVKAAKARVSALEWSVASDRAQQAADSAVMRSLQERIKVEEATANNIGAGQAAQTRAQEAIKNLNATYDAMLKSYTSDRGVEVAPSVTKPAAEWDDKTGEILVGGVAIGEKATSRDDAIRKAQAYLAKKPEPTKPEKTSGILSTPETITPLESARRLAAARANAADVESAAAARTSIEADIEALGRGAFDVKSQANFRKLTTLFASSALNPAEKLKVGRLLQQY